MAKAMTTVVVIVVVRLRRGTFWFRHRFSLVDVMGLARQFDLTVGAMVD
jgi:hypothetical protein